LDISDLTVETLKAKIDEVLKTEYKKNIEKLRDLIYDQPMSSREKAVWWVEYVLRHKTTDHLDYIGRHIPFYQKYFLDFIGIAGLFLISIFILIKFSFEKFRFNIVATDKKRN
jgi:glucuronosyltransferase